VSLSSDGVVSTLSSEFVCGWRNIADQAYCGMSGGHSEADPAVYTTNGAGPHNIQLFVLASDGTVLHCLPGYWNPEDLAAELAFAQEINRVWTDRSLARAEKDRRFRQMHLGHVAAHSQEMVNRSVLQGFDKKFEDRRAATSDAILSSTGLKPRLRPTRQNDKFKTTDQIMHERVAEQPFVSYASFDVAGFSDYGRPRYDKPLDGGTRNIAGSFRTASTGKKGR
jgi:hypothetical protein